MVKRKLTKEELESGGKLTKVELESIRSARKGRFITPSKSRKIGGAITQLLSLAVPQEAMAGSVSYAKKGKKGGDGRGRPKGTFKARYVPGYGTVKVPTAVYRRMMSKAKSDRRLAEAQKQAGIQQQYEAQQTARQAALEQYMTIYQSVVASAQQEMGWVAQQRAFEEARWLGGAAGTQAVSFDWGAFLGGGLRAAGSVIGGALAGG